MARPRRSHVALISACLLAVLVLHVAALWWLSIHLQQPSLLKAMAEPVFARTLTPTATRRVALTRPPDTRAPTAPTAPLLRGVDDAAGTNPAPPPEPQPEAAPEPPLTAPVASAPTPAEPVLAVADTWPPDSRVSYILSGYYRGDLHGRARVQWQRDGDHYQARLGINIGLFLDMSMTSQGSVSREHLLPELYEEITVNNQRRFVKLGPTELQFQDGARQVRPKGVQDTASQFVELSHRFAQGAVPPTVGQAVSYWMARPGGADEWTFDIVALETLDTPRLGQIEALHLKPRPLANPRGPITAEMWFAPSLQYLPVRIRINMASDVWLDLMLESIEQAAPATGAGKTP